MSISVPDVRQKSSWDCGYAVCSSVLQFFGKPAPSAKHFPATGQDGTDPASLAAVLRRADLGVLSGEMAMDDLRHQCQHGRPVVCLIQHNDTGHYVVVTGYSRGKVQVQCPSVGPHKIGDSEFLRRWWDVARDVRYNQYGIATWEMI